MHFMLSAHPVEFKKDVACNCILIEHFVKSTKFEKQHFIEIILFVVPVLNHARSKILKFVLWNKQRTRIIRRFARN